MIEDLDKLVDSAVTDVFQTMLGMAMRRVPPSPDLSNGEPQVAGSVGFVGKVTGVLYIYASVAFARRITGTLLQLADHEIDSDEMVNDAIGEMANMLVGHMKSCLSDRGMACALTIPSIVRGSHFSVEPVSSVRGQMFAFETSGSHVFIEVLFKSTTPTR